MPEWITGCSICSERMIEEVKVRHENGQSVNAACKDMETKAVVKYPELKKEFSANRIRDRYRYHMQGARVGQKAQSEQKAQPDKQVHKPPANEKPEKRLAKEGENQAQVDLWDTELQRIKVGVDRLNREAVFPVPKSLLADCALVSCEFNNFYSNAMPPRKRGCL